MRKLTATLVLAAALAAAGVAASPAGAVVRSLTTYPVSIDVDLDLTMQSDWKGIRPGCFAPAENFSMTYRLDLKSRSKGKKSVIKKGTATLTGGSFGTTPSYGDTGSFRQFSDGNPWELQTANPAGCGTDPAPAPPSWATSPTCKKVSERVSATLLMAADDKAKSTDGALIVTRSPKAKPTINGATVGASCFRTFHAIDPSGIDSNIAIGLKDTLLSVPVPGLSRKLRELSEGSSRSRPSFTVPIRVSGTCGNMKMTPFLAEREGFTPASLTQPHNALGSFNGDPDQSTCTIAGRGRAIVRREGKITETAIPVR